MRLTEARNRIEELLAKFVTSIDIGSRSGRTDLNKDAETILIPLLNEVYGWSLINLNSKKNYPGIDLADEVAGVSIQVTATLTLDKVKKTLKQFIEDNQYLKYSRLIIFILRNKEEPYSNKSIQSIVQNKFNFDPQRDILNHHDLFNKILEFEISKTLRVQEILEANFGEDKQRQLPDREISDKVERIVQEHEFFIQRPEQNKLDRFLCERSSGLLLITANAGFGKTALLANWIKALQEKSYFVTYHFFQQRDNATVNLSRAYRNLLQQLHPYYGYGRKTIADLEEERRNELYYLLSHHAAWADQPLVILIDALDEAERTFTPPFPVPLPKNVFVIVSAREGKDPEYLRSWADTAETIALERLSHEAIVTWLKKADGDSLAELAEDNDFVSQLDEITQGYPLYLRYLTDELSHAAKQGQNIRLILEKNLKVLSNTSGYNSII